MFSFKFTPISLLFLALLLILVTSLDSETSSNESGEKKWISNAREEWQSYAREKCPVGTTEDSVEENMSARYLAKIHWPYNSGLKYQVIYRVDDVTELIFDFENNGVLAMPAKAVAPRIWVRNPYNAQAQDLVDDGLMHIPSK